MRPLTPKEKEAVAVHIDAFRPGLLDSWLQEAGAELWVAEGHRRRLHVVEGHLARALRAAAEVGKPLRTGLYVGDWVENGMRWSLEGAYEVGRRAENSRVVVEDKAAQLFLYGRNILAEGVHRAYGHPEVGQLVFVQTRRGDVLGIARVVAGLKSGGTVMEPVADRGWYLREGG